ETLRAIDMTPSLQAALGRNGRAFFERHYAWPVIEKKYVDMLQQLSKESAPRTMAPTPGWFARRRRSQPPADSIVKKLPAGPYREEQRTKHKEQMPVHVEPRREFRPQQERRPEPPFDSRSGRAATGSLAQGKQQRPQQQRPQEQQRTQQTQRPQQQNRPPQSQQ